MMEVLYGNKRCRISGKCVDGTSHRLDSITQIGISLEIYLINLCECLFHLILYSFHQQTTLSNTICITFYILS